MYGQRPDACDLILVAHSLLPRLQHIVPELSSASPNDLPILKADALKFVTTFRGQLPKDTLVALFPSIIK